MGSLTSWNPAANGTLRDWSGCRRAAPFAGGPPASAEDRAAPVTQACVAESRHLPNALTVAAVPPRWCGDGRSRAGTCENDLRIAAGKGLAAVAFVLRSRRVHRETFRSPFGRTARSGRPCGFPGVEKTRRILRSTATCSRCLEVKSEPLSV